MQGKDPRLSNLMERVRSGKNLNFVLDPEGVLCCGNRLCMPDYKGLREAILQEAHNSKY